MAGPVTRTTSTCYKPSLDHQAQSLTPGESQPQATGPVGDSPLGAGPNRSSLQHMPPGAGMLLG